MPRSRRAPMSSGHSRFTSSPSHSAAPTPQVTNVFVQRPTHGMMGGMRGGGGSGILGTMAAVAGGSVIGHGISNYLYGHNANTAAPTQPAEAQELAQAAAQENHICTPQLVGYSKCLEANPESADNCKWAWDYFMECRRVNENNLENRAERNGQGIKVA